VNLEYFRLTKGLSDKGQLIPVTSNVYSYIRDKSKDFYISMFKYNESQKQSFYMKNDDGDIKGCAGIIDVKTNRLIFDFDNKDNLNEALDSTKKLYNRLIKSGFNEDCILVSFSGNKGFGVEIEIDKEISPKEQRKIAEHFAGDLKGFDFKIYNASRIIRVLFTKHPQSGLYKIPLTKDQLLSDTIDQIKNAAKSIDDYDIEGIKTYFKKAILPDIDYKVSEKEEKKVDVKVMDLSLLDFSKKPKFLDNARWAIQNGFFSSGERHSVLMWLASSYRNLGFNEQHTYYVLKGAADLQSTRTKSEKFSKDEIWNNIVMSVYSPMWKGGEFKEDLELWKKQNGIPEEVITSKITGIDGMFGMFKNYALNYESNVLKTGVSSLDKKVDFLVGTFNGILAPPSVGKTTLSLQILNHNSKKNIQCIFFSYDMFHSMVFMRLMQKHTGMTQQQAFDVVRNDPKKIEEITKIIQKEYANVNFCFESGQTIEDLQRTIRHTNEKNPDNKVKLIIVDYNELVITNISDPTQSSAFVAQRLRQVANEEEVCVITLLQPSKLYSSPADEITTYQGAKGSGAIAQAMTLMLSLSRPGFHPRHPEEDNYFTINALKNRNGSLFTVDLHWNGLTGQIRDLTENESSSLKELRDMKQEKKDKESTW
jgi:hypothetical protein